MKVQDIMTTSPKYCLPSDSASKAARIMRDMDTGIIPIVESERSRRLTGVVTDRDLCLTVIAEAQDPETLPVGDCMTSTLVCCTPDDDVQKAVDAMRDNQVRRIPVVDQEGTLQGVVSLADIIERSDVSPDRIYETLKKICEPTQDASKPRAQMRKSA